MQSLDEKTATNLLTELLHESSLYRTSKEFLDLLAFTGKLRNLAPFNALLVNIQKPGVQHVATRYEWQRRFRRTVKEHTRPLLILVPFGPVALVYDVADTEGKPVPPEVLDPFPAAGEISELVLAAIPPRLAKKNITVKKFDYGSGMAGWIEAAVKTLSPKSGEKTPRREIHYTLGVNANHNPQQQFCTITHELAHLFLGHIRLDDKLKIKHRGGLSHQQREIEAESVAYLVCLRNNIQPDSRPYLAGFMAGNGTDKLPAVDVFTIMKAAGAVETILCWGPEPLVFGPKEKS